MKATAKLGLRRDVRRYVSARAASSPRSSHGAVRVAPTATIEEADSPITVRHDAAQREPRFPRRAIWTRRAYNLLSWPAWFVSRSPQLPSPARCLWSSRAMDAAGSAQLIQASSYDQSCKTDTDCVWVAEGDFCRPGAGNCPNAAISKSANAQYQADVAKTRAASCYAPGNCGAESGPCCIAGQCQVGSQCPFTPVVACKLGAACSNARLCTGGVAGCTSNCQCLDGKWQAPCPADLPRTGSACTPAGAECGTSRPPTRAARTTATARAERGTASRRAPFPGTPARTRVPTLRAMRVPRAAARDRASLARTTSPAWLTAASSGGAAFRTMQAPTRCRIGNPVSRRGDSARLDGRVYP